MTDFFPPSIPALFDRMAHRYDLLNRIFSLGRDMRWRRRMANRLATLLEGGRDLRILDIAAGTGDQTLALFSTAMDIRAVYALDPSRGMLGLARHKITHSGQDRKILLIEGDALSLPFPDGSLDAVTISFGIRNIMARRGEALREMRRVLRPGGVVLILELTVPTNPVVRPFALFHMRHIIPLIGGVLHGEQSPYHYLNQSIEEFPKPEDFLREIGEAGFVETRVSGMTMGAVQVWEGRNSSNPSK